MHADIVTRLMTEEGFEPPAIDKVRSIITRKQLQGPEGQTIEDGLCLVFLERQLEDFVAKESSDDKVVAIIKKSLAKMSARGKAAAMQVPLGPKETELVKRALQ